MIVVSDTSPINYLVLVEFQNLLPKLFDRILIPEAVHRELQSDAAPDPINDFLPKRRTGWKLDHRRKSIPPTDSSILANARSSRWRCRLAPIRCCSMNGRGVTQPENADSECQEHLV
jgi:hypothetical protein